MTSPLPQQLIAKHQCAIHGSARRWAYRFRMMHHIEDLRQEGYLALMHAWKKFDPNRGVKFETYLFWWVKAYLSAYVAANRSAVSIRKNNFWEGDESVRQEALSLDEQARLGGIGEPSESQTWLDLLRYREEASVETEASNRELRERLEGLLVPLAQGHPVKVAVIWGRFLGPLKTLEEIANEVGCSHQNIKLIEGRLMGRVKWQIYRKLGELRGLV